MYYGVIKIWLQAVGFNTLKKVYLEIDKLNTGYINEDVCGVSC